MYNSHACAGICTQTMCICIYTRTIHVYTYTCQALLASHAEAGHVRLRIGGAAVFLSLAFLAGVGWAIRCLQGFWGWWTCWKASHWRFLAVLLLQGSGVDGTDGFDVVARRRQLAVQTVSSTNELVAAIGNSAVSKVVLQTGTYDLTSTLSIDRAVTIEALVAGSAVLNGRGKRRVFLIDSSGEAQLNGLNITGGFNRASVGTHNLNLDFLPAPRWISDMVFACVCRMWALAFEPS